MRRFILLSIAGILAVALSLSPASGADRQLPEVHFTNGLVYYALGFTDMATKEFQRVCELDPANSEVRLALGMAYQAKGDLNGAVKVYEEVLAIDSDLVHVHGLLGDIYRVQGDSKRARAHYLAAKNDPELLAIPCYGLGVLAEEAGDTEEAIDNYREVLKNAPDHIHAALRLSYLLREIGLIDEALEVVSEANRYNPREAELHYEWGLLYLEKEEYNRAEHEFDRVLQLENDHSGAQKQLQDLQMWKHESLDSNENQ